MTRISSLFFDKLDYQLLQIVDDVLKRGTKSRAFRSLFVEYMHPHGIKEMAAPQGLRIAYAVISLLGSFENGMARDRLKALRSLRDEVFLSSSGFYRKNTARVLLQIMKKLVRPGNSELNRLKLAHDFRMVSAGNPRKIRKELAKYHLVEMPEEWNQYAFDDHVHDANTKGRKSPTHLIMDAWIKGIREITVVYYNYVRPQVIEELLEAGNILDIKVHVGIELSARFRNKFVRFTWEPNVLSDTTSFQKFMEKERVIELFEEGREVSRYQQKYVFDVLNEFNSRHSNDIGKQLDLKIPVLDQDEFIGFVGTGQPSILHLGRFIHNKLAIYAEDKGETKLTPAQKELLRTLTVRTIIDEYLAPAKNPQLHDPAEPHKDTELPELLRCNINELMTRLLRLHSSSKFTLNLANLTAQDTLELLYDGGGMITHIEAYNLKDICVDEQRTQLTGQEKHYKLIGRLQKALNEDSVITLKSAIREIIYDYDDQLEKLQAGSEAEAFKAMQRRKPELVAILSDLEKFHTIYRKRSLRSRIGSGSTGQAEHRHGMGFVVLDTLPARARKPFYRNSCGEGCNRIPVSALMTKSVNSKVGLSRRELSRLPEGKAGRQVKWTLDSFKIHAGKSGNIGTLGGLHVQPDNSVESKRETDSLGNSWNYLNTNIKNTAKVLLGFIPAFLTFFLTKDWWLLSYFGAVIWFAITGSRNIIQSVLGGGGLRRSPLLPWNSLVSWSRISDSLLYTGFSVPLLDYLVKTLLLDNTFGVTTSTNPILLYSVMGLANGIYLSSHNAIRGLPKGATVGNFFRSILAIPVAVALSGLIGALLGMAGIPDATGILQKWAAIISKFASDGVAAFIEGLADRQANIKARIAGYKMKITQLFSVFSKLDLMFPEEDVLEMLQSPKIMMRTLSKEARDLEKLIIVNALDLMYFWLYQPRSRKALSSILQSMSREEWLIFYRSQLILKRHKEISQVFVDGLVGKDFSKALSFYLDQSPQYLADMEKLGKR
ncbi:hypothetical protein [Maridesulfovibrio salexigens]|uniref:Uncharacterized protein n=1 Tax=Maridesulfovibrio salexigens (strain ATCC 14822 / DSM 2638 / NCIMB 8403 / VKM B-1763) TaxID=526222 RepID=C6BWG1_MARSD|nr:hypothetical protein [Maridesulfovibrio salexigens]ACS78405.1 conserved hypothetical protein [Maridesulfovibrio salexigens DSM 2638]